MHRSSTGEKSSGGESIPKGQSSARLSGEETFRQKTKSKTPGHGVNSHEDRAAGAENDSASTGTPGRGSVGHRKRASAPVSENRDNRQGAATEPSSPKKRRRKRRRKKSIAGQNQTSAKQNEASAGSEVDATDNPVQASEAGRQKKRGRRRRGGRRHPKNAHQDQQQLRNVRAPAKTAEDVTFDPERADDASRKRRHRSDNARHRRHDGDKQRLYAALDLGTNNCRLLVAQPQEFGRFRVVDAFSRIVRLGEGLGHSGRLGQDAMDRSIEALKVCAKKLKNRNVRRFRLIATEACRRAENGQVFLDRVREETGLELEIVNRETEARLAAEGCGALMDRNADGAVLFDIGGGSSELILVDRRNNSGSGKKRGRRRIADRIASWTSLPLGVVTLAERHGGREVTQSDFDNMVDEVRDHIHRFEGREKLGELLERGQVHLLGTSGTVTTLAGVHLKLPKYDRRKVDGTWLTKDQIDVVMGSLLSMTYEERAQNPCIGRDRADLVLAGCAVLEAIRREWPCERLRVADRGLREGLLTEMISSDGAWRRREHFGRRSRYRPKSQNND